MFLETFSPIFQNAVSKTPRRSPPEKPEFAAHSGFAIDHDAASMGMGKLLNKVQPDPESDEVRILLGLDPGKPLEQLAHLGDSGFKAGYVAALIARRAAKAIAKAS